MKCNWTRDSFSRLLDGELDGRARRKVEEHLEDCSACFSSYLQFKMDHARVRTCVARVRPETEEFADRTMDRILTEPAISSSDVGDSGLGGSDADCRGILDRPGDASGETRDWLESSRELHTPGSGGRLPIGGSKVLLLSLTAVAACVTLIFLPRELLVSGKSASSLDPGHLSMGTSGSISSSGSPNSSQSAEPDRADVATSAFPVAKADDNEYATETTNGDEEPQTSKEAVPAANSGRISASRTVETVLSSLDPSDMVDRLISAFEGGDLDQVDKVLDQIGNLTERVNGLLNELQNRLTNTIEDSALRRVLVKAIGAIEDDRTLSYLRDLFEHEESTLTRRVILQIMADAPNLSMETLFLDTLAIETDPKLRRSAIRALGLIGSPQAIDAIHETLQNPETQAEVRLEALETLEVFLEEEDRPDFDGTDLLETFEEVIHHDGNLDHRIVALRTLSKVAGPRAKVSLERISASDRLPADLKDAARRHLKDRLSR